MLHGLYKPDAEDRQYWNDDAPASMNARAYAALPKGNRCTCGECGWRGNTDDLQWPRDLGERIEEGDPMWAGDCPRCDSLVNSDGQEAKWAKERKAEEAARAMLAALELLDSALFAQGCTIDADTIRATFKVSLHEYEIREMRAAIAQAKAAGITSKEE